MDGNWKEEQKREMLRRLELSQEEKSCREVLELCLPVMEKLLEDREGPDDWLEYILAKYRAVYFPDSFPAAADRCYDQAEEFYLDVLNGYFRMERQRGFRVSRDFDSLSRGEIENSRIREEFLAFQKCFVSLRLYEFMRISRECTKYDTLGHIAGVHNVAVYMARQFTDTPVRADLGLISAAAVLHDIGKFGCRQQEADKVPYLHYYYTGQFSSRFGLRRAGHIAANHSVWDLELENLSLENLLLIYSDFRVKSVWDENGKEVICFWTLDEAYQVILDKLDHVDENKKRRYTKVYRKLKDFEGFMEELGISPALSGGSAGPAAPPNPVNITSEEIVRRIKHRAVRSNICVMDLLSLDEEFFRLLEEIKGEKDWRNIRASLNVLEEYFTYMTYDQKDVILNYLYEMLMHRDGDIRRQSAGILGKVIAGYRVPYLKQIPDGAKDPGEGRTGRDIWKKVLEQLLDPGHRVTLQQRRWSGFAMKQVFVTALENADESERRGIVHELVDCFRSYRLEEWDELNVFLLMDCAPEIPLDCCSESGKKIVYRFSCRALERRNREITIAVLRFWHAWILKGWRPDRDFPLQEKELFSYIGELPCFCYLVSEIRSMLGEKKEESRLLTEQMISSLMLENQRMEVPWIFKAVHLQMFARYFRGRKPSAGIGIHLVNLLEESDRVVIKHLAGELLRELFPSFTEPERYELVLELIKGIDAGEYAVSRYLPEYLGKVFCFLPDEAQRELTERYRAMADGKNGKTVEVTMEAVGITLQQLLSGKNSSRTGDVLEEKLEGILCRGMAHVDPEIRQTAFYVLGCCVFGSRELTLEQKAGCYENICKKVLFLTGENPDRQSLYSAAAALNHLYRFLSDYLMQYERIGREGPRKAAFFPGTFDPFSLGHKQIVREAVRLGCEVFVAVDEFSWSKKTQPYNIRKKILRMSVADLRDVYLFPEEIPVNIANPKDMETLDEMFRGREWYLIAGTDVADNASAYRGRAAAGKYNHILVKRGTVRTDYREKIKGKILYVQLPEEMERVSSTKIRENIDRNMDISSLVDENVQNYIYSRGLYAGEPQYRQNAKKLPYLGIHRGEEDAGEQRVILAEDGGSRKELGFAAFRRIKVSGLYHECRDAALAAWLRDRISGKIAVLTGICVRETRDRDALKQIVLTEMLAFCLKKEYTYLLCFCPEEEVRELLLEQGFVCAAGREDCLLADLRRPLLLFHNTETVIKEPFSGFPCVKESLEKAHRRIHRALTGLYPGSLVLSVDARILNYRLICLIQEENAGCVRDNPEAVPGMCVPYGSTLRGIQIPDTVTKELHTDKFYERDMSRFTVRESPEWSGIETQIRTLRSFGRPVLLVDDLYHKGYRMDAIDPWLVRAGIPVRKIIAGVLSGQGEELAGRQGRTVRSVYYIPNLRAWFAETDMYPFLGGARILDGQNGSGEEAPQAAVNPILPYQIPRFLEGASMEAFYKLSRTCLNNAGDILAGLGEAYQKECGRKLTAGRLGEVITEPRYPDICREQDMPASLPRFLEGEIDRLARLEDLIRFRGRRESE